MKKISTDDQRKEFVDDWNRMVLTVANFGDKYDLPKGEMIFHPLVLDVLRDLAQEHIRDTLINHGVRVRFGRFEQADVLRTY